MRTKFTPEEREFWEGQCKASNSLYNCAMYEFKQRHYEQLEREGAHSTYWKGDELRCSWKLRKITATSHYEIDKLESIKSLEHYRLMQSQSAQQTLRDTQEVVNSFNKLVSLFFEGGLSRPRFPRYRKSGGLFRVTFPVQSLRYKDGFVYPGISNLAKTDLRSVIKLEVPDFVDFNLVREIRIRPSRGDFWVDWVCDDGKDEVIKNPKLDYRAALSIDHGIKFWLCAVTTKGKSFIVEAPQLKAALWEYQEKVKQHKKGRSDFYWNDYLDELTGKHNRRVRDAVNKAARFIINRCLRERLGNLIIGWNKGNKQNINLGKRNNYEVVNMPTARLIKRLSELCPEYGIRFIVTSEEYTSKASFVDQDVLHQYGEKPAEWKPSGRRISRDVYKTSSGKEIHADINAAANILRKVADRVFGSNTFKREAAYSSIRSGALTDPKRYDIFKNLKKGYRENKRPVARLQAA
ncbi:MAG: RNA-guided endonuclease InsQ/TnpB family protein [Rivularia sp. (in: cyanobacteria)]